MLWLWTPAVRVWCVPGFSLTLVFYSYLIYLFIFEAKSPYIAQTGFKLAIPLWLTPTFPPSECCDNSPALPGPGSLRWTERQRCLCGGFWPIFGTWTSPLTFWWKLCTFSTQKINIAQGLQVKKNSWDVLCHPEQTVLMWKRAEHKVLWRESEKMYFSTESLRMGNRNWLSMRLIRASCTLDPPSLGYSI